MYYCCFLSFSSSFLRRCLRHRNINAAMTVKTYIAFASSKPNLTLRMIATMKHIMPVHIHRISMGCYFCFIFLPMLLRIVL